MSRQISAKHAILLAGQAASVDRTDQLAAILAESPHLNRLADQFADDVPVLVAGNWKDINRMPARLAGSLSGQSI